MGLLGIIVVLCVFGLLAWAFWTYVPIPQPFKGIVMFLIILFCCLFILKAVGGLGSLSL